MKLLKKMLKVLLVVIILIIFASYITGNEYILKAIRVIYLRGHTTASIDDYPFFYNRIILAKTPQIWPTSDKLGKIHLTPKLQSRLEKYKTSAFLVIHRGEIIVEQYWEPFGKKSRTNSFSMAKTIVTNLLAAAIQDGYIQNLDQPISDFFSSYNKGLASKVTVGDLSRMSSGMDWHENYYLPFNITTRSYFDSGLDSLILNLEIVQEPGKKFRYLSGSTQLLALVIEKATGKTITNYLSEKFWKPLGMNDDGLWALDGDGKIEKAYCCIYSNARNFAKFGQLYLLKGNWNGEQLIDTMFIEKFTTPVFAPEYGYSWWTNNTYTPSFYSMIGHLGQFVIVVPLHELVIVRLGENRDLSPRKDGIYVDVYEYIDEVLKIISDIE